MRRILAVALLGIVCACPASTRANSRFSLRGPGEATRPERADVRALGGAEAASLRPSLTGNPASLAFLETGTFHGSFETEWIDVKEPLSSGTLERKDYVHLLPNLGLLFPLSHGIGLGLGIVVDRRLGGRIEQSATAPGGQEYEQVYEASGNVLRFPFQLAWGNERIAVGSGIDVVLSNSRIRWRNDFPTGSEYLDTNDLDSVGLWGAAWRTGVRVPIGSRAAVGGWISVPSDLSGTRRIENDDPGDDGDDLELHLDVDHPTIWAAGVDGRPLTNLRVVADWVHEGWKETQPRASIDAYRDVDRFAFGLEWSAPDQRSAWPLRLGFRTEKLPTLDGLGRAVREKVLTAGTGFGFAQGRGNLDAYLDFGQRGDESENEFAEKFVRFGLTLTGFEGWNRPAKPEAEDDW
jgi:hypothetical protein